MRIWKLTNTHSIGGNSLNDSLQQNFLLGLGEELYLPI